MLGINLCLWLGIPVFILPGQIVKLLLFPLLKLQFAPALAWTVSIIRITMYVYKALLFQRALTALFHLFFILDPKQAYLISGPFYKW